MTEKTLQEIRAMWDVLTLDMPTLTTDDGESEHAAARVPDPEDFHYTVLKADYSAKLRAAIHEHFEAHPSRPRRLMAIVLTLNFVHDYTLADIAEFLSISRQYAQQLRVRALAVLAKVLDPASFDVRPDLRYIERLEQKARQFEDRPPRRKPKGFPHGGPRKSDGPRFSVTK